MSCLKSSAEVWFLLSFRHEMLLPVLLQASFNLLGATKVAMLFARACELMLQVLRIHISVDNLRAFFRGMQGASAGKRCSKIHVLALAG